MVGKLATKEQESDMAKSKVSPAIAKTLSARSKRPAFEHFIATNEYGFYCVPNSYSAREVPQLLRAGRVYEPDTLNFMRRHAGSGDIISGGAFVGDFFPALAQALAPKAQLHSFEPNPTSLEAAQTTIALNGLTSINLAPVAVGEQPGTLPLLISRGESNSAMAAGAKIVAEAQGENTIDVEVTTLDDLIPASRQVSLLQLDIEGFELPAVKGAARIINDNAPIIILEGDKRFRRRAYLQTLEELAPNLGYEIAGVIERNCILLPRG